MSKAEYWQRGEVIDYTNATEAKIEANQIIVLGSRIGVAGTPIEVGETGSLHVFGVFEMPKDAAAIAAGASVYYNEGEGVITATAITAGYATEAAAAEDTTVKVKLLG